MHGERAAPAALDADHLQRSRIPAGGDALLQSHAQRAGGQQGQRAEQWDTQRAVALSTGTWLPINGAIRVLGGEKIEQHPLREFGRGRQNLKRVHKGVGCGLPVPIDVVIPPIWTGGIAIVGRPNEDARRVGEGASRPHKAGQGCFLRGGQRSIRFELRGTKSNRDAIGAKVRIEGGGERQELLVKGGSSYLSQSELPLTFGLGARDRVERAVIRWPSGREEEFTNLAAGLRSSVVLCHIVSPIGGYQTVEQAPPGIARTMSEWLEESRDFMSKAAAGLSAAGIDVETVTAMGDPQQQIVRLAKTCGAGLIAMATRGRDSLEQRVMGSVANQVLDKTSIPCLLLRRETQAPATADIGSGRVPA